MKVNVITEMQNSTLKKKELERLKRYTEMLGILRVAQRKAMAQ